MSWCINNVVDDELNDLFRVVEVKLWQQVAVFGYRCIAGNRYDIAVIRKEQRFIQLRTVEFNFFKDFPQNLLIFPQNLDP